MNDLIEIVEDLEAISSKIGSIDDIIEKWCVRLDDAETEMESLYLEMDDGA